ncbi:hypothetical protein K8R03_05005 [Candidatus Kaiserbacteria bacterium]|nr:hypothetical protein [Candidatus Kaiserbacteria bacterium]
MTMTRDSVSNIILRVGVAFAFLYPPIDALANPYSWIGYFPPFMHGYISDTVLLHSFGALEVVIALWILSGWRIFWPSLLATLMLLSIVIFDFNDFEVLFRDLSIAAAAAALAVTHYKDSVAGKSVL